MAQQWVIEAYSPSLNQTVREFQLSNLTVQLVPDQQHAQQAATTFANRLNSTLHMRAGDWQPRATYQDLGIHTIPGYIG